MNGQQADHRAEQCLEYHAAIAAGIVGVTTVFDRRSLTWVASAMMTGLAVHATCLFLVPSLGAVFDRAKASLMPDRTDYTFENRWHPQPLEMAAAAMNRPPSEEF